MKKILVVAAHPDDEVLGVGGTMRKFADMGINTNVLILGEGETSRAASRNETNKDDIISLHKDTMSASKIIGYKNVSFADFPDNRFDSADLLEITKKVEYYIEKFNPDTIFTHSNADLNLDHRITNGAVLTATRPIKNNAVNEIYVFETPSSTEWNFDSNGKIFKPNVFMDISDTMQKKLSAMACYKGEVRDYPHPRSLIALKILAARWGIVVGRKYVEAFELIRKII
jgi:LmbE family N-acetylglucosaminyl deacetylase